MWQTTDPFESQSTGTLTDVFVSNFGAKVKEALKDSFNPKRVEDFFLKLEASAVEFNRTLGVGIQSNMEGLRVEMFDIYKEGQKFGFALEDSGKFLSAIQGDMGRLIPTSKEVTTNALIFGKVIGDTPENVGKLIAGMTSYGITQDKAVNTMNKVAAVAKASGLDMKKLTATVSKDLYKTQIYGFKNGVDGLTKMAAQAQRVGFSLEKAQATANKILDGGPEKAIEMASELQALGGNIGSLGDPFQLIHMAQYDMEGLQDQIINASASAVQFNETTGDFKISGEEMLRLRKQADILGLSYEDVAKGAINMRKEQEVASRVDLTGLNEEQKNLVASLAEIGPNGSVKIDLPGFEGGVKDLQTAMNSPDFMTALNKYGEDLKISQDPAKLQQAMYTNAENQLSTSEKMLLSLQAIQNQSIFGTGAARGKKITDAGFDETMYGDAKKGYDDLTKATITAYGIHGNAIVDAYKAYSLLIQGGLTTVSAGVEEVVRHYKTVMEALTTPSLTIEPPSVSDAFIPAGGKSMVKTGFGQILPDTADQMLFSPDIGDFFDKYNESEKRLQEIGIPKGGDLSMMYKNASATPTSSITNLDYQNAVATPTPSITDLMSKMSNISSGPSEIKQTVEIGGKTEVTLNINSNMPQNLISQVLDASQLKETIMNTVNDRLSAAYSDKLTNALITQKRG